MSEKRLSIVTFTDRPLDHFASGLLPGRKSVGGTTIISSSEISPASTRRRNSSAMGILETLAIGKARSPFNESRVPDSRWMAATPTLPLTRRAMRSSLPCTESGTEHTAGP